MVVIWHVRYRGNFRIRYEQCLVTGRSAKACVSSSLVVLGYPHALSTIDVDRKQQIDHEDSKSLHLIM